MSDARDLAAAVARSKAGQRAKPLRAATGAALLAGYLPELKARRAEVGVWEIRGRVLSKVMAAARNARLAGGHWGVLATVTLHLQHLGKSKGWMTLESIAKDSAVSTKTARRALQGLVARRFLTVEGWDGPRLTVRLHARFKPTSAEPVNNPVDKPTPRGQNCPAKPRAASPRPPRSGRLYSAVPAQRQSSTDSDAAGGRAESPSDDFEESDRFNVAPGPGGPMPQGIIQRFGVRVFGKLSRRFAEYAPAPPPKGGLPVASG